MCPQPLHSPPFDVVHGSHHFQAAGTQLFTNDLAPLEEIFDRLKGIRSDSRRNEILALQIRMFLTRSVCS